jgi:ribosomal-protein-alanine N-acetyltransferase
MLSFDFHPFPVLKTTRLVLRTLEDRDAEALFRLRNDNDAMRYIERPRHKTQEESLEMIRKVQAGVNANESIGWTMTLPGDDTHIGSIGYHRIDRENHRAEIGYMLDPRHWRKGLMSEAISAVLGYGFRVMKLHSIEANVNPENAASSGLLEKHGFVREAYFRENYFFNGNFYDTFIYSLLASRYKQLS